VKDGTDGDKNDKDSDAINGHGAKPCAGEESGDDRELSRTRDCKLKDG